MDFDGDNDFCSLPVPQKRRHYKKDSRFVFDLYTLCYDENESVDTVELFTSIVNNTAADNWSEKRRSDREEIRRRLAMGSEEHSQKTKERNTWKTGIQSRLANAQLGRLNDPSSDTESHSSDSETCPKLSKTKHVDNVSALNISLADKPTYPYAGSGHASISSLSSAATANKYQTQQHMQRPPQNNKQQSFQTRLSAFSSEDLECDFFTKQAKLQIEARMALAQAKEMAHMQMEIERQNRRVSPITDIIRVSLRKVGVQMTADKRRVSRQMLTDMNIAQLQILVNSLHTHIEELNESLVHNLMERDDLHVSQDSMLVDIEELTRYIGANEHLAQRYKNQNPYNHN
uniref:Schwannomin-interacting protein 1 n=1 Tax=Zeugodacus cucurbitae TaxID=28588 RepID=A0A0A1X1P9_ZEUCU